MQFATPMSPDELSVPNYYNFTSNIEINIKILIILLQQIGHQVRREHDTDRNNDS